MLERCYNNHRLPPCSHHADVNADKDAHLTHTHMRNTFTYTYLIKITGHDLRLPWQTHRQQTQIHTNKWNT